MNKHHYNAVLLGNYNCGKSTLIGHLLYNLEYFSHEKFYKIQNYSSSIGKASYLYAMLFTKTKSEIERGITIQNYYNPLETKSNYITLIDISGLNYFLKQSCVGISQADIGILVISASSGEFENGINKFNGLFHAITTLHAAIAHAFGIKKLIICINKMDCNTVKYAQKRYNDIVTKISQQLKKIGYKQENLTFIPISALNGDNLTTKSENIQWYDGKTLFDTLDNHKIFHNTEDYPLTIPIYKIFTVKPNGRVITGCITSGTIKKGSKICIAPLGNEYTVQSLEINHIPVNKGKPGDIIGILIDNEITQNEIKPGFVIGSLVSSPPVSSKFLATIIIVDICGYKGIHVGYRPILYCHSTHQACKIIEIQSIQRSGEVIKDTMVGLRNRDKATVIFKTTQPMCIYPYKDFPKLGRFILLDSQKLVGIGIVEEIYTHGIRTKAAIK